jgi:hypothetical protein
MMCTYYVVKIRDEGANGTCSTHGEHAKCIECYSENVQGRGQWGTLDTDGRTILNWILL